jgi:hypothetical protein
LFWISCLKYLRAQHQNIFGILGQQHSKLDD